jgi:predicted RecB family nuclease
MLTRITRDILESYLHCKYKAHLKLAGEKSTKSEYECLLAEMRGDFKIAAIDKIVSRHAGENVVRNVGLTHALLNQGALFIFDSLLEDKSFSLCFDGLKRVNGPSTLGNFHYVPLLFHEGRQVRKEHRLMLGLYGLILSSVQGRQPESGVIIYGEEGKHTQVCLAPSTMKTVRQFLEEIKQLTESRAGPTLMLNEHCKICEFKDRCHAQALSADDISLLQGMGEKEIKRYNRKGIFTLTQLSCTFRPRRRGKRTKKIGNTHYSALQALAIRDNRIYVYGTPSLPDRPVRVFLDVEGNSDGSFVYLIGMTICDNGVQKNYSFWADTPAQEQQIFDDFLNVISAYDHPCVFHFGSYEKRFLVRMSHHTKKKKIAEHILGETTNVLSIIYAAIYFPTLSNGLKDIGKYLGCMWTDPDASGIQSLVWRRRWQKTSEESLKSKLSTYNLEDCGALKKITECIYMIIEASKHRENEQTSSGIGPQIGWAEEFRCPSSRPDWRGQTFSLPDFDFINKCAYFDYQREKVFFRTSKAIRRSCTQESRKRARKPRPNRKIEIRANKCPRCSGGDIARSKIQKHVKVAYDLRFSEGGIRRQVIHCIAALHKCRQCKAAFYPERYKRRDKHFHSLKSWAMYQHIVHRISLNSLPSMLQDCFDLHISGDELYTIKSLMAKRYQATWKSILRKILAGGVIHIDETHVNLPHGKGYVWVLTSLEEVIYIYRATREGDFLQELLKGFTGVVISDFYSAYDSLPFKQQKCLVHLLRDFNNDLLSDPYDEEFKTLASEFGQLLRCIIVTIDRYGLKRSHLNKHKEDVDRFFSAIMTRQFRSELALSYQKRLVKNRDKLFTFLDYDGVPWNNNNAECAIKQFAEYRKLFDGRLKEAGLDEYLVLLSIQQTCRYKGVSFLKFLLSREKDVENYIQEGQQKYKPPDLEIYPAGYPRKYLLKRREGNSKSQKH